MREPITKGLRSAEVCLFIPEHVYNGGPYFLFDFVREPKGTWFQWYVEYSTDNIKHVKVGHSHLEERKSVKSGSKFNSTIIKPSTTGSVPVVRIFSVISVSEDVNKEN